MMYPVVVFLHILGVFGFLLAHGASASVAFKLREARSRESICTLLDLSSASLTLMYASLGLLLLAGIVAGFMRNWWSQLWIWTAIVVLIAVMALMYVYGTLVFAGIRKAVGMPYFEKGKMQPPLTPATDTELFTLVQATRPWTLATIGGTGLALLLALMVLKPF